MRRRYEPRRREPLAGTAFTDLALERTRRATQGGARDQPHVGTWRGNRAMPEAAALAAAATADAPWTEQARPRYSSRPVRAGHGGNTGHPERDRVQDVTPHAGHRVWIAPGLFMLVILLLVLARQGRALELVYPVLALAVGVLLYRRYPVHYVGYLCWISFLTPEVRRLADFYNGAFNPTSPIQTAPLAIALLSVFTLIRQYRLLGQQRGLPFLMVLIGLAYAYPVGVLRNSPLAATFALTQWLYPVLIGFHMLATGNDYPAYGRVIGRTFIWGTLVMGLYGIVQFFFVPPWDAFWLIGTQMVTEGLPLPMQIRVSSTMNSSAPFAVTIMAGLLLLISRPGKLGWVAGVAGFLALLLTVVRAAWGGWVVGLAYSMLNLSNRMRVRVLVAALVLAALSIPLLTTGPVAQIVAARFATVGDLNSDTSFNERSEFYRSFVAVAFSDIAGQGLGVAGDATRLGSGSSSAQQFGSFDSGLMEIPYTLGWPGALMFFGGVGWLLARALAAARRLRHDRFASACISISVPLVVMLIFLNTLTGFGGMLFYLGAVMPIIGLQAARR